MGNRDQAAVTFENLWAVFRDGDTLVLQDQLEEMRLFKLTRLEEQTTEDSGLCTAVQVHFWHICWSSGDKGFRRSNKIIRIPKFPGMRRISTLPIYPLCYEGEEAMTTLLGKLKDRGEKWSTHVSDPPTCYEYDGYAVTEEDDTEPTYVSNS